MFGWMKKAVQLPKITTVIGQGTEVRGDVHFQGGLHVDGRVIGRISAEHDGQNTLVLSELGEISGDIEVPNVVLNGLVRGDVKASNRVELASKANIQGNVYYASLEMMLGAVVNGQLVRADAQDPTTDTPTSRSQTNHSQTNGHGADSATPEPETSVGGAGTRGSGLGTRNLPRMFHSNEPQAPTETAAQAEPGDKQDGQDHS
jgi:cytoskeletal protein CcmA (bactofilin family)